MCNDSLTNEAKQPELAAIWFWSFVLHFSRSFVCAESSFRSNSGGSKMG